MEQRSSALEIAAMRFRERRSFLRDRLELARDPCDAASHRRHRRRKRASSVFALQAELVDARLREEMLDLRGGGARDDDQDRASAPHRRVVRASVARGARGGRCASSPAARSVAAHRAGRAGAPSRRAPARCPRASCEGAIARATAPRRRESRRSAPRWAWRGGRSPDPGDRRASVRAQSAVRGSSPWPSRCSRPVAVIAVAIPFALHRSTRDT
jgi:hypothetical protein